MYIAPRDDVIVSCVLCGVAIHHILAGDEILERFDYLIFEGAQGLLLDKNNKSFFPNLTPANTGIDNVLQMLYQLGAEWDKVNDVEVCYVTRSYFTRHGAGHLPTECEKTKIAKYMVDLTNHYNEFQGDFRYGYFDRDLFVNAVTRDLAKIIGRKIDVGLSVTHLDETNGVVADGTEAGFSADDLYGGISVFNRLYKSYGAMRSDVNSSCYKPLARRKCSTALARTHG